MVQTALTTQQQIEAIARYLSNDWTAEESELLETRRKIAQDAVPKLLARATSPVSPNTIDDFVKIISEAPESEQGIRAIDYLASLNPPTLLNPPALLSIASLINIVDSARLKYINEKFLNGAGDDRYGLNYGALGFRYGKVGVEVDLNWEQIRTTFPDDSTMTAVYSRPIQFRFDRNEYPVTISKQMDVGQVIDSAVAETRKGLLQHFENAVVLGRQNGFNIVISVQFPEGKYDLVNGLQLTSYTPRLQPMLEKILEVKQ